jgi:hypothetical protein
MESESSTPCSKNPATLTHHAPIQPSPHLHFLFIKIHFNYTLVSPCSSFTLTPLDYLPKILYAFCLLPLVGQTSRNWVKVDNILWTAQMIKQASAACPLLSLRSKYSSQHSVLEYPQSKFFPSGEGPTITSVNRRKRMSETGRGKELK